MIKHTTVSKQFEWTSQQFVFTNGIHKQSGYNNNNNNNNDDDNTCTTTTNNNNSNNNNDNDNDIVI